MAQRPDPLSANDQPVPQCIIYPAENVFSYFMFIGPTESKKSAQANDDGAGGSWSACNWDIIMGYVLIFLNFFVQGVLLYLIFEEVVVANVSWQNGIVKLGSGGEGAMGLLADKGPGCNDGGSLCFKDSDGSYSCAPPSVQLVGRWHELDTNKDGIWQREEAEKSRDVLKCKYVVDPVDVFDVLISMLKEREKLIWLHPDIKNGSAVHLPYFEYIKADVIMCSYRSEDMCSNLLERGVFHAPLKYGTSPRVGRTIESALDYCKELLAPGGKCERNLPSTYAVWKITSQGECGDPSYEKFKYTNPGNANAKSLLRVDYSAREEYALAQETMFRIFKGIIIFAWLLLMVSEVRDILKILNCCARLPDAALFGDDAVIMERDPKDPEDVRFRIQGFTSRHRWTMVGLSFLRFLMLCVLAAVGCSYIIKTNEYPDLIMNGVALAFIAEISSVLYTQVLREEIKDQTSDIKSIKVDMIGIDWLNHRPALIDMLCVIAIWVVVYIIMYWNLHSITLPVYESLECTCLSEGSTCIEANKYNFEFWHEYWLNGIPGVYKAVAALKDGAPATAASYLSISSAAGAEPFTASATSSVTAFLEEKLLQRVNELDHENEAMEERMNKLDETPDVELPLTHPLFALSSRSAFPHDDASGRASLVPDGHRGH